MRKKICIIGAGAAGLGCLRYFTEDPEAFTVVAYEQGPCIGGNWIYTDDTGIDKYGRIVHSSLYESITVNVPKEIMAFPDFPFDASLPSFFGHEEVLKYLNDYADHFQLHQYIQFDTRVLSVVPEHVGEGLWGTKWKVQVQPFDDLTAEAQETIFDAVIVCNGHFSVPSLPEYEGFADFQGPKLHGKNYRRAKIFKDKKVLTVGGSLSGWDITLDVSTVAKQVFLSHYRDHRMKNFPDNVELVAGVKKFTANGVILTDGRELSIDAVIFNTGYSNSFPFLSPDCGFEMADENTVTPLYKHTISITQPTLSFITIVNWVLPFPCISLQARFVKAMLDERLQLPSEEEMRIDEEAELQKRLDRSWPVKYRHRMQDLQGAFYDDLANLAGVEPLPPWLLKINSFHFARFFEDIELSKKYNYRVVEPDGFDYTID